MEWIKKLLRPPEIEDAEGRQAASLAHALSLLGLVLALVWAAVRLLLGSPVPYDLLYGLGFLAPAAAVQVLLRLRRIRAAAILLTGAGWAVPTLILFNRGGLREPLTAVYPAVILAAGLLLGTSGALSIGALSFLAALGMALLEAYGLMQPAQPPAAALLLANTLLYGFAAGVVWVVARRLVSASAQVEELETARRESDERARSTQADIERIVAQRTAELAQRAHALETAAEIGRLGASTTDFSELAHLAAERIRAAFDLYYVGVFIRDEATDWAVLRAGTGEAGQKMLKRGHRIQVGSGMIGWSIANAQPRFALTASEDIFRIQTPELPETRSEAALPLRSRGQTLGAVSLQSARQDAFDRASIEAFQEIADQLAVVLDNARLFEENQAAARSAREAQGRISRQGWDQLIGRRTRSGYRFDRHTVLPIEQESWSESARQAASTGSVVAAEGNGGDPGDPTASLLSLPLKIRGQVVGCLLYTSDAADE